LALRQPAQDHGTSPKLFYNNVKLIEKKIKTDRIASLHLLPDGLALP
jgi:hypothetical protein